MKSWLTIRWPVAAVLTCLGVLHLAGHHAAQGSRQRRAGRPATADVHDIACIADVVRR